MANRQALKELQTRIAARLQAAQQEQVGVASWLAVQTAGRYFLLPLVQAGEIFSWAGVHAVPYTQPWFLGVANLRGNLCSVVDLAAWLGLPHERTEQSLSESSLLTLNAALGLNAALLVDELVGLRSQEAFTSTQPPESGAPPYWGRVYVDAAGVQWQELSLQELARETGFLSVGS